MAPRGRAYRFLVGLVALLLILGTFRLIRYAGRRQRERDEARAVAELRERLASAAAAPERVEVSPAPVTPTATARPTRGTAPASVAPTTGPESHEGWVVASMRVWCEDGRWAGEADVHATTESPRTWGFVFTLTDGTRDVGELHGQDDRMGYMDPHPLVLRSSDPCVKGTFGYRWTVAP